MLRAGAVAGTAAALGAAGLFGASTASAATTAHTGRRRRRGHTCIELDEADDISRVIAIYDSSLSPTATRPARRCGAAVRRSAWRWA